MKCLSYCESQSKSSENQWVGPFQSIFKLLGRVSASFQLCSWWFPEGKGALPDGVEE